MAGNPPHPHRAKKSLGQNFLIDPNTQRRIVEAIDPHPTDEVVEIGPGMGALTDHLIGRVGRLVLVELDDDLAAALAQHHADDAAVIVVHRDILEVDLAAHLNDVSAAKVIGNIPYNITTPIIFHLLDLSPPPQQIVLMIQREVADRILADAGSRTYGALAVGVQVAGNVERVLNVGRGAFRPAPDVDSTVIRITPRSPSLPPTIAAALRELTRLAFGTRRKQFQRSLRDSLALDPAQISTLEHATGFDLRRRPETFSPPDFVRLTRALVDSGYLPRDEPA